MKAVHYFSFFVLLISSPLLIAEDSHNETVVREHILIGYERLEKSTAALERSAAGFCKKIDDTSLSQLKGAYLQAMYDWQSMQHIRFGPVDFLLRYYRFQTWPDKRGAVVKHIHRLLQTEDKNSLEEKVFAQGSTAVQGFSALERLLYSGRNLSGYSCDLIVAISHNLHIMTTGIIHDWQQPPARYLQQFISASNGNDYFESDEEVTALLLNNLYTQLQFIVDQKLDRPLGSSVETARGKRAESWKSSQSLEHIRLNLAATASLFEYGFAPRLGDDQLKQEIAEGFQSSLKALEAIGLPLHMAVSDPNERKQVEALRKQVSQLKGMISVKLTQELGIPLGFNSLDGD